MVLFVICFLLFIQDNGEQYDLMKSDFGGDKNYLGRKSDVSLDWLEFQETMQTIDSTPVFTQSESEIVAATPEITYVQTFSPTKTVKAPSVIPISSTPMNTYSASEIIAATVERTDVQTFSHTKTVGAPSVMPISSTPMNTYSASEIIAATVERTDVQTFSPSKTVRITITQSNTLNNSPDKTHIETPVFTIPQTLVFTISETVVLSSSDESTEYIETEETQQNVFGLTWEQLTTFVTFGGLILVVCLFAMIVYKLFTNNRVQRDDDMANDADPLLVPEEFI